MDGRTVISECFGLVGSAALGEIVQTMHIVCRKSELRFKGIKYTGQMLLGNDSWILL